MKAILLRATVLLLALAILLTACNATPPVEDTTESVTSASAEDDSEGTDIPTRETYEDLSSNVPEITGADGKSTSVTVEGERSAPDVALEFNGESGLFAISSTLGTEIHDAATCEFCGFSADGDYYMSSHNLGDAQVGFSVTLATPIPLSTVTGITVTYRTSGEATNSAFRIMTSYCTTMATFHNECPSLAGASEEYRTLDINLTNPDQLADDDGNLSAFQIYFRNKDKIDVNLRTLTVCVNPEKLLTVDKLDGNYFSRGDVTAAIAAAIAERFKASGVGAQITVEVDQYRQNSTKMDGSIRYKATATLNDGTVITGQGTVVVPHVSGVWLDTTSGSFGASHDNLGQWRTTFDPSGMVLLTNNTMSAKEGVTTVEYALIPESGSYDDATVVWRAPHVLRMSENSIDTLFVNAWLDYANALSEGQRYRLLVRGVTANENYILHLDVPFTYSPLDQTVNDQMSAALKAVESAEFICPADTPDKAAYVTDQLTALLNDPTLEVRTTMLGEGVNSATVRVTILSNSPVTENRLPAYTLDGEALTAVYGYEGDAMTSGILNFPYDVYEGSIRLTAPFDGDTTVVLASPEIYALWNAPLSEIESGSYPFKRGENCLPTPAELTWTDTEGGSKTYTVTVSQNRDLSDPIVLTTTECRAAVYDLEIGRTYYWQVSDGSATSQLFTFATAVYPRFFELEGISNFRDVGGYYTTDGKRVKQNMMFRSAYLNDGAADAKSFIVNDLGVRSELDLRGSGAATFGSEVDRRVIAMQWYSHIFTQSNYEVVRQTVSAFADPDNYPMNFHCAVGRDRTGTTAFLILGLLGVDEETLVREYYSSFFSQSGSCSQEEFELHIGNINGMISGLRRFAPKGTLQEQIESYLLTVGVTEAEIASIREILLED